VKKICHASHPPIAPHRALPSATPAVGEASAPALPAPLFHPASLVRVLSNHTNQRPLFIAILLATGCVFHILTGGIGDLYNETDGQYAGAARAMVETGDWLVPVNNEVPRLVKPPLLYWIMAGGFQLFGINEFAARLPNALGITLLALFTLLIGERIRSLPIGFLAGMLLLLLPGSFILGRVVMPEPLFAAAIAAAVYALVRLEADAARRWVWLFWAAATFAVFIKGIHGLLYPAAIAALAALLWPACRTPFRRLADWRGLLLFLLVQLPWMLAIEGRYPGFLRELFVNEQIGHLMNTRWPPIPDAVSRWQFLLLHLFWFFPAILLALAAARQTGFWKGAFGSFRRGLPWLWLLLVFGTVLIAGQRQDYYSMPGWPAVALLLAGTLLHPAARRPMRILCLILGLLFLLLLPPALLLPSPDAPGELADAESRATAAAALATLPPDFWTALRLLLVTTLAVSACGFLVAARMLRHPQSPLYLLPLACGAGFLGIAAIQGVAHAAPFFSSAEAARAIHRLAPTDAVVAFDGAPPLSSSLTFYLDRPFHYVGHPAEYEFGVRATGTAADRFLSETAFTRQWHSTTPTFLIIETGRQSHWRPLLHDWQVVTAYGSHLLIAPTTFQP